MRFAFGLTVLAWLVPPSTRAEAQGNPGSVRVGLQSSFYAGESLTIASVDEDADDIELSTSAAGVGAPGLGASIGFVIGDYAVLGGRVLYNSLSFEHKAADVESSQATLLLLANVEAVLLPGGRIRPMFAGLFGLRTSTATVMSGDVENEESYSGFAFGATGGIHFFGTDTFSITPTLSLIYSSGSSDVTGEDRFGDAVTVNVDQSSFTIMVAVELAGWMGGDPREAGVTEAAWGGTPGGAGSMGTAPSAAAPPMRPATVPDLPPNAVTGEIPLQQSVLNLVASWSQPDTVELRMRTWGMQARFRDCPTLILRDAAQAAPLQRSDYRIGGLGRGVEEIVIARAPRAALERLLTAPAPGIALCATTWELDAPSRNLLDMFLRRLREQATRYGTLQTGPAPAPAPAPAPGPAPAPPPGGAAPAPQDPELGPTWGPPPGM